MKKKYLPWIIGIALVLVLAALFIFGLWYIGILLLLLLAAGAVYVWVGRNRLSEKLLNKQKPTSYFTDLTGRNMAGLVVGGKKTWKYLELPKSADIYKAVTFGSSTPMLMNIVKTYFSHVKKQGDVYFVYDSEDMMFERQVTVEDNKFIHPHLFLEQKITIDNKAYAKSYDQDSKFMRDLMKNTFLKKCGEFHGSTWTLEEKVTGISEKTAEKVQALLENFVEFCRERDLKPHILLINKATQVEFRNNKLMTTLNKKYGTVASVIFNADELNRTVAG